MKVTFGSSLIRVLWSKSWYTLTPWADAGRVLPYFSLEKQAQGDVSLYTLTLGPIAILYGRV